MAQIPTTAELRQIFLANLEGRLSQTSPNTPKSFLNVMSTVMAMVITMLYKYGTDRTKATLALTATDGDLDLIGAEEELPRVAAVAAQLNIQATGVNGTAVAIGTRWISDDTGANFTTNEKYLVAGGVVDMVVTADDTGDGANLGAGATMTIGAPIINISNDATVGTTAVIGLDREEDPAYRRRILTEIRQPGGGGNFADYRKWSEAVDGVLRAFPYSGKPLLFTATAADISFAAADKSINTAAILDWTDYDIVSGDMITVTGSAGNSGRFTVNTVVALKITVLEVIANEGAGPAITVENTSLPGDRAVFIEATTGVDGIPTPTLLQAVRDALNVDPDTGLARPAAGDIEATLYVEPITRTTFDVEVSGLVVPSGLVAETKVKISSALTTYFAVVTPFIVGLDFELDRNNAVTDPSVSGVVQDALVSMGAVADGIVVEIAAVPFTIHTLSQGELAKLGAVTYV